KRATGSSWASATGGTKWRACSSTPNPCSRKRESNCCRISWRFSAPRQKKQILRFARNDTFIYSANLQLRTLADCRETPRDLSSGAKAHWQQELFAAAEAPAS